jgi:HlyD family secretion protein
MKRIAGISLPITLILFVSCGENRLLPGGSGFIEATEIVVSAEATGRLEVLFFDEGSSINKNDTIAIIDTVATGLRLKQVEAAIDAARSKVETARLSIEQSSYNLKLADKEFNRVASLIKSGSANQQQYDQTENAYHQAVLGEKQAQASLGAAKAERARLDAEKALLIKQLHDCFPTAPVGGIITDKYLDVGELAAAGKALIKIAQLDTVWVKIYLPPADLTGIKLGDKAEVDPEDGRGTPMTGTVAWISSEAEFTPKNVQTKQARADLVYAVKITIPNPEQRLKTGMPVAVRIT